MSYFENCVTLKRRKLIEKVVRQSIFCNYRKKDCIIRYDTNEGVKKKQNTIAKDNNKIIG